MCILCNSEERKPVHHASFWSLSVRPENFSRQLVDEPLGTVVRAGFSRYALSWVSP